MVVGTGVDVVKIERIERLLGRWSQRFERKIFSPAEAVRCRGGRWPARRFAECFALKEAVLKAAGTGRAQGASWLDVETHFPSGGTTPPILELSGRVAEILDDRCGERLIAAVGGCHRFAVACVIVEGRNA